MLARVEQALVSTGEFVEFAGRAFRVFLTSAPYLTEVLRQSYRITIGTLPIILLVSIFIGANMIVQGYQVLKMLGAETMLGMFASFSLVREMAPALGGAMVGVKAGSEMASELATMKIRSQIDAIDVMGVDPVRFLVVPRVLASVIAMPIMTAVTLYAAIGAGYVVAVYQFDLNGVQYISQIMENTTAHDLFVCIIKSLSFGLLMALIQCYAGFRAEHGPQGVGLATNHAIVAGISSLAWVNLLISAMMY